MPSRLLYFFVKNGFRAAFTLYNGLRVTGRENIPDVPVIVASNHASNVDPPLIGGVFPRRLRYLAKDSLFKNPLLGFFIRELGAIPVARADSARAGVVLKMLLECLSRGESVLIFPEGSRSQDGKLKPLEGGAAYLSVKSGVPILPAYIRGSHEVCPPGVSFPRPGRLSVSFAPLLYPVAAYAGDRERRGFLTARLAEELKRMRDQP